MTSQWLTNTLLILQDEVLHVLSQKFKGSRQNDT